VADDVRKRKEKKKQKVMALPTRLGPTKQWGWLSFLRRLQRLFVFP